MLMRLPFGKGRVVEEHRVCAYHAAHPGKDYAGCTCMSKYGVTYGPEGSTVRVTGAVADPEAEAEYTCPPHAYQREGGVRGAPPMEAPPHTHGPECLRRVDAEAGAAAARPTTTQGARTLARLREVASQIFDRVHPGSPVHKDYNLDDIRAMIAFAFDICPHGNHAPDPDCGCGL